MVYPSHYEAGSYGIDNPNANPYELVTAAMKDTTKRLAGTGAMGRPWLQDFSLRRRHLRGGRGQGADQGGRGAGLQRVASVGSVAQVHGRGSAPPGELSRRDRDAPPRPRGPYIDQHGDHVPAPRTSSTPSSVSRSRGITLRVMKLSTMKGSSKSTPSAAAARFQRTEPGAHRRDGQIGHQPGQGQREGLHVPPSTTASPPPAAATARAAASMSSGSMPVTSRWWASWAMVVAIAPRRRPRPLTSPRPIRFGRSGACPVGARAGPPGRRPCRDRPAGGRRAACTSTMRSSLDDGAGDQMDGADPVRTVGRRRSQILRAAIRPARTETEASGGVAGRGTVRTPVAGDHPAGLDDHAGVRERGVVHDEEVGPQTGRDAAPVVQTVERGRVDGGGPQGVVQRTRRPGPGRPPLRRGGGARPGRPRCGRRCRGRCARCRARRGRAGPGRGRGRPSPRG